MVLLVFCRWKFYEIVFIDVWCVIPFPFHWSWWVIHAVIYNLMKTFIILTLFLSINSCEVFGHLLIENGLWFELPTCIFKSWSLFQKRLLNSSSRKFNLYFSIFLSISFLLKIWLTDFASAGAHVLHASVIWQIAVILCELSGFLVQPCFKCLFRFILALASTLIIIRRLPIWWLVSILKFH